VLIVEIAKKAETFLVNIPGRIQSNIFTTLFAWLLDLVPGASWNEISTGGLMFLNEFSRAGRVFPPMVFVRFPLDERAAR